MAAPIPVSTITSGVWYLRTVPKAPKHYQMFFEQRYIIHSWNIAIYVLMTDKTPEGSRVMFLGPGCGAAGRVKF